MIYVVARHEGQYSEYCRKAGLIPDVDVSRLQHLSEVLVLTEKSRVILLHDWHNGITASASDFFDFLVNNDANITSADW